MTEPNVTRQVVRAHMRARLGMGLAIVAFGGLLGTLFSVVFYATGNEDKWPWGIALVMLALFLIGGPCAYLVIRSGASRVFELADATEIAGLDDVTGPLVQDGGRADIDAVVNKLAALDAKELPYSVNIERDGEDATVTVEWRSEEIKWRTALQNGSQVMRWRMVLRLDGSKGRYRFTEYSSTSTLVGSALDVSTGGATSWHRGKSMGAEHVTQVWAVGEVEGPAGRSNYGRIALRRADAKIPVFRILRSYGWRPRVDNDFMRLWEN